MNITLEPEEAAWLAHTLNLVMELAHQWDMPGGERTGQRVINKLQSLAVMFEQEHGPINPPEYPTRLERLDQNKPG
jgi:hypothetical protein